MARFAAGRTVLMIWVAMGCVVALLVRKKQGKRLGAGWRGRSGWGRVGAGAETGFLQTRAWVEQVELGGRRERQTPSAPRSRGRTAPAIGFVEFENWSKPTHRMKCYGPGYREGRSGLQRRTCVHTVDRQNTQDGKHWLELASPSQRQGSPKKRFRKLLQRILLYLSTSSTVASGAKEPEVVALAQQ